MDRGLVLSALVVLLLAVNLFMCWVYACGRWRQRRSAQETGESFAEDDQQQLQIFIVGEQRKGLDKAMVDALPTFIYNGNDQIQSLQGSGDHEYKEEEEERRSSKNLECPVCLSEFQHKERGRVLPNCRHRFHVDCIDTWLLARGTCPVCRASCAERSAKTEVLQASRNGDPPTSSRNDEMGSSLGVQYPTNVLFWGNNSLVSSRASLDELQQAPAASTIIQIYPQAQPLHAASSALPLPSSSHPSTPPSSSITTLNSLRRLLSRERRQDDLIISNAAYGPSTDISILKA